MDRQAIGSEKGIPKAFFGRISETVNNVSHFSRPNWQFYWISDSKNLFKAIKSALNRGTAFTSSGCYASPKARIASLSSSSSTLSKYEYHSLRDIFHPSSFLFCLQESIIK
eukprot:CAMPEP_0178936708 /NCGR_PEP_ID=MMETSP0786-20121207/25331_1 /TAXON_ID=186022 /ORGANISM="Thalassionema frauenfeldii, Strain CCMP 1798" /LENGTH=110 /DNA_ID=CAMNT_0020615157 /DNA_START=1434 /DNA_END=1766 /DNA_ORIENTATION=+